MAFELKDNTGSLFKNDKKEKDNQPDWKGTVKINGVEYYLYGWDKLTKAGDDWISLSAKVKTPF